LGCLFLGGLFFSLLLSWGSLGSRLFSSWGLSHRLEAVDLAGLVGARLVVRRGVVNISRGMVNNGLVDHWGSVVNGGLVNHWGGVVDRGLVDNWGSMVDGGLVDHWGRVVDRGLVDNWGSMVDGGLVDHWGRVVDRCGLVGRGWVNHWLVDGRLMNNWDRLDVGWLGCRLVWSRLVLIIVGLSLVGHISDIAIRAGTVGDDLDTAIRKVDPV